jgi:AAA+ ATPase superfamily predicted ATPase
MLLNPFTPSEIASSPEDFYGRSEEIKILETSLNKGSVAIFGGIGIGKSSLLARVRLLMEGFNSHNHKSKSIICVGDKNIKNIDEAARMILERLITVDERHNKIKFKIGEFIEIESGEICRYF